MLLIAKIHFQIQQVVAQMANYQNLAKEKNNFQPDEKKLLVKIANYCDRDEQITSPRARNT